MASHVLMFFPGFLFYRSVIVFGLPRLHSSMELFERVRSFKVPPLRALYYLGLLVLSMRVVKREVYTYLCFERVYMLRSTRVSQGYGVPMTRTGNGTRRFRDQAGTILNGCKALYGQFLHQLSVNLALSDACFSTRRGLQRSAIMDGYFCLKVGKTDLTQLNLYK